MTEIRIRRTDYTEQKQAKEHITTGLVLTPVALPAGIYFGYTAIGGFAISPLLGGVIAACACFFGALSASGARSLWKGVSLKRSLMLLNDEDRTTFSQMMTLPMNHPGLIEQRQMLAAWSSEGPTYTDLQNLYRIMHADAEREPRKLESKDKPKDSEEAI